MSFPAITRKASVFAAFVLSLGLASQLFGQGPITPGNVVIVRVGTGAAALSNAATAVFLDEYTTAGVFVQTLALPTAVNGLNRACTASGTATSEAMLTASTNGQYLMLAGYDAIPGTAGVATSASATVNRVVARVDLSATIDTSTALTAYSGGNIRCAASDNGTQFWTAGQASSNGGIQYVAALGATTSTQLMTSPSNIRVAGIYAGQLYVSSATGAFQGVSTIGMGLPTTAGQVATILPGFPTATGPSNYDFYFADPNTLYVADDRAAGVGGIQKWTLSAGTWTLQYTLHPTATTGCRGLTGTPNGGSAILYATTTEASANHLVTVTDTGPMSAFTNVATAPAFTAFRGARYVASNATVTSVGVGCPGTGNVTPTLSTTQLPSLNNLGFAVDVTNGAVMAPAFLFASVGVDLVGTPVGGGCTVFLDFPTLIYLMNAGFTPTGPVVTGVFGEASLPFPIPYVPQLAGIHVGLQAAVFDAGNPIGITLTNALELVVN